MYKKLLLGLIFSGAVSIPSVMASSSSWDSEDENNTNSYVSDPESGFEDSQRPLLSEGEKFKTPNNMIIVTVPITEETKNLFDIGRKNAGNDLSAKNIENMTGMKISPLSNKKNDSYKDFDHKKMKKENNNNNNNNEFSLKNILKKKKKKKKSNNNNNNN